MKKLLKWLVVGARIGLGALFIYAGIQKFNPKPRPQSNTPDSELPAHVVKIKELIGGMKQAGYFWEMVGVAEITCGVLLVSQVFALLGAVMLVPITLNIFLFHAFLQSHDTGELLLTGLYFLANLLIIGYHYPQLKQTFLTIKLKGIL